MKVVRCEPSMASLINCDVNCDFESADGLDAYEVKKMKDMVFATIDGGHHGESQVNHTVGDFCIVNAQ